MLIEQSQKWLLASLKLRLVSQCQYYGFGDPLTIASWKYSKRYSNGSKQEMLLCFCISGDSSIRIHCWQVELSKDCHSHLSSSVSTVWKLSGTFRVQSQISAIWLVNTDSIVMKLKLYIEHSLRADQWEAWDSRLLYNLGAWAISGLTSDRQEIWDRPPGLVL